MFKATCSTPAAPSAPARPRPGQVGSGANPAGWRVIGWLCVIRWDPAVGTTWRRVVATVIGPVLFSFPLNRIDFQ